MNQKIITGLTRSYLARDPSTVHLSFGQAHVAAIGLITHVPDK